MSALRMVFLQELKRSDKFLTEDDLRDILHEDNDAYEKLRESIVGYPSHPIYKQIAQMLQIWMKTKNCPILDLPSYDLLDEQSYVEARAAVIKSITPLLDGVLTLYTLWNEEELVFRLREILLLLGKRGLLDLLGIRKTVGTKDIWPPARSKLMESFEEKHSEKAELSVGARALAKHHHRDQSESWWGTSVGSEKQKNEHALTVVNKILDNATWINIHWLPQDIFVIEARVAEGYGARWRADGSQFRGFLEPQMADGHEVGWKH
ncbi:uncharacterized protein LOC127868976 isoform X2 [Dreissena polymorpha]|uniref:uncharacterized protein LOC127868976 isoform X2 n=1 Tax=Dreissena polymorpha TaxID=45954 RepID=UPI00226498EC|nr:uncharacterized protein LOC127868976 isoform X2 [Dreissena polymorpha]